MRHLLLLDFKEVSLISILSSRRILRITRAKFCARNDRWRENSSFVDGNVDVDESSRLREIDTSRYFYVNIVLT